MPLSQRLLSRHKIARLLSRCLLSPRPGCPGIKQTDPRSEHNQRTKHVARLIIMGDWVLCNTQTPLKKTYAKHTFPSDIALQQRNPFRIVRHHQTSLSISRFIIKYCKNHNKKCKQPKIFKIVNRF